MEIRFRTSTVCAACGKGGIGAGHTLAPWPWHVEVGRYWYRRSDTLFMAPVCRPCWHMEQAILEAREEMRRFTEIDVRERCVCGAATHAALGFCVLCWRASRMLRKELRDVRMAKRIAQDLRRQALEMLRV